jgi:hypothetical protein
MLTFSIITPTVLRDSLVRTCASVDGQNCGWQHLVMVDKPEALITGRETALLRRIAHAQREIRFCDPAHADCGNTCRSNAWEFARGTYVLYVDDDDFLLPEALTVLASELQKHQPLPVWGVFPIERFGQRFLILPPGHSRTCSTQFFHQRAAGGSELRFPIAGYCADGVFVDSLLARFPYVCIDPGRPLAVVDQRNLGQRIAIDRAAFETAFREYVQGYSIETEAISLNASYYLLELFTTARIDRILDLGSGWSSFVFRYLKRLTDREIHVCSVDESEHWLGVTAAFLARHGLDTAHLRLWPSIGDESYDLVFYDMGRPWDRHAHLKSVLDRTRHVLVCDDMHYPDYRGHVAALASSAGLRLQLLEAETIDSFGRFMGRVNRPGAAAS